MARNPDALAFAVCWIVFAFAAGMGAGWSAGLVLSLLVLVVVLPVSALLLMRTGNFALERKVRWGILGVATLLLLWWTATAAY